MKRLCTAVFTSDFVLRKFVFTKVRSNKAILYQLLSLSMGQCDSTISRRILSHWCGKFWSRPKAKAARYLSKWQPVSAS